MCLTGMNIFENKIKHFENQTPLFITIKLKKIHDFFKIKTTFHGFFDNNQQFRCHFIIIKLITSLLNNAVM